MASIEENFPRGGSVTKSNKATTKNSVSQAKDLFKDNKTDVRRKKRKNDMTDELDTIKKPRTDKLPKIFIEAFSAKIVCEDMLILGCVKQIHDLQLVINLPGGMTGIVPITAVSDSYQALLYRAASDVKEDDEDHEDVVVLEEIFKVGMPVWCKVTTLTMSKFGKKSSELTVNPKDVNSSITSGSLANGMVLTGSIISREDHGYFVDLGIKNMKAFLKNKDAEKYIQNFNNGFPLHTGQIFTFGIVNKEKAETRVINVTIDPKKTSSSQVTEESLQFNALTAGMTFTGTIKKVVKFGLFVEFCGHTAMIHSSQLREKEYKSGEKIKMTILYIHPTTKEIHGTVLPHIVNKSILSAEKLQQYKKGDIIKTAQVCDVQKKRGVYFEMSDNVKGFSSLSNLSDKPLEEAPDDFTVGTKHKCRVMDLNYMDNLVIVTLKQSILDLKIMSVDEISPGQLIDCTVGKIGPTGMTVNVTKFIEGFIFNMHMADIPLKYPEKKFLPGNKLKCRVLTVDMKKLQLRLTNKKSLVRSKLPIVSSYDDVDRGQQVEGFIGQVNNKGILVIFYNNVKGWVPVHELSTEKIAYPERVFFVGQIVRCRVINVNPEEEKMKLSFKIDGIKPFKHKTSTQLDIGDITRCRVVSKKDDGLHVSLGNHETEAFLPKDQLSDAENIQNLLLKVYDVGDEIENVMVISKKNITLVSKRQSLTDTSGKIVSSLEDIDIGMELIGQVKKWMPFGMFVSFPGDIVGLAPIKNVCDHRLENYVPLYRPGQTIVGQVIEVDKKKKRVLISTKLKSCMKQPIGVELCANYLSELTSAEALYRQRVICDDLNKYKIKDVAMVTVNKVTTDGALCCTENGVKGVITKDHMEGCHLEVGTSVECVVLNIDTEANCLELSAVPEIVTEVQNSQDSNLKHASKLENIRNCIVLLAKPHYTLVLLKGQASGVYAYLPSKRHWNDVLEQRQFSVHQENKVVIKKVLPSGIVIAELKFRDKKMEKAMKAESVASAPSVSQSLDIKAGDIKPAIIKSIRPSEMIVLIQGFPGRVHITEVTDDKDDISKVHHRFSPYHTGEEIKVRVLGYKVMKKYKGVPSVSRPYLEERFFQCSIKPSILSSKKEKHFEKSYVKELKKGTTLTAYIDEIQRSCIVASVNTFVDCVIPLKNVSDRLQVLKNPGHFFKPGQAYKATVIKRLESRRYELSLRDESEQDDGTVIAKVKEVEINRGIIVDLLDGTNGLIGYTDMMDDFHDNTLASFKRGKLIKCAYIQKPADGLFYLCSLRPSRMNPETSVKVKDQEILSTSHLEVGKLIRGFVTRTGEFGVTVNIGHNLYTFVHKDSITCEEIDPSGLFTIGKVVTVKVVRISHKKIGLSLLEDDTGVSLDEQVSGVSEEENRNKAVDKHAGKKRKAFVNEATPSEASPSKLFRKDKKLNSKRRIEIEEVDSGVEAGQDHESDNDDDDNLDSSQQAGHAEAPCLKISHGFVWNDDIDAKSDQSDDSDGSEDLSVVEMKETPEVSKIDPKEEEKKIHEYEMQQLAGDQAPHSGAEFDKLTVQSPNSSIVWLRYMAYHLELSEIEKARAVAEKALKTISFREEQEKMNVWVGYFNLENMYGTQETLKSLFDSALKMNDEWKIYQQLVQVYIKSGKTEDAELTYLDMIRRFGSTKDIWIEFGWFYARNNKIESSRKLMQRSLKNLPKGSHVPLIAKFAEMEFKHAEPERGKTMFENILTNYPKKSDLWSVYIDMVIKCGQIEAARHIFERVITMKFSAKGMKFFFKKYLDFETKHSDGSRVDIVKKKALEYVESRGFVDD